ncbi:Putative ATPase [Baekduia alba]|uniref:ArsA-related P-loop ATPase n=1 Tax=Baekduia alba TaxID=2997333 RepID=UPI00233FDE00|nr:ArsA-related P-loop ATPase [Baekduia alba]WCB94806.1 Putative ATPase [Baekduia alba]
MNPNASDKRLVVVTGKGGTGRTTVAAALALGAARRGRRTVLAEVGGASRLGLVDGTFDTVTIDPEAALEEWLGHQLPRRLARLLARSGAFGAFVGAAPGARELVTIYQAWALGEDYDTVVLDAPASGHGVALLRTPRTFADIARVGPIARQARTVADALADPAVCRLVAVALPGELAVAETLELEAQVEATLGRSLDAIVVNGVWPRRLGAREAEAVDGAVNGHARRAALAATGRVRTQQTQLSRLRREASTPIQTLPFVFTERLDDTDVAGFATRLERGR